MKQEVQYSFPVVILVTISKTPVPVQNINYVQQFYKHVQLTHCFELFYHRQYLNLLPPCLNVSVYTPTHIHIIKDSLLTLAKSYVIYT
jgi:hypothetical protein